LNKVLVTGGSGFLGGRIAKYLGEKGYEVYLASRNPNSTPNNLTNVKPVFFNWNDADQMQNLCSDKDVVIHAAGMSAEDCAKDPIAAFEFNCIGTMKLIEATRSNQRKKFIYLSTAHVYRSPLLGMVSEESIPKNNHPYATSHLAGEFGVNYANVKGDIEGYNLRLSNGFGSPISDSVNCWSLFVNDLCRQVVTKRQITIHSDEEQQRDFIPISNIEITIEKLIDQKNPMSENTFNLGSGKSLSLIDMAKKIQFRSNEMFRFLPEIITNPNKKTSSDKLFEYNVDRLKSFQLSAEVDIDKELDSLLLYCQNRFGGQSRRV